MSLLLASLRMRKGRANVRGAFRPLAPYFLTDDSGVVECPELACSDLPPVGTRGTLLSETLLPC